MEQHKEFEIKRFMPFIRIITILVIVFVAFKVSIFLFPFVISMIVVTITRPFEKFLREKLMIKSKYTNSLSITIFYLIIAFILVRLFTLILAQMYDALIVIINNMDVINDKILMLTKYILSLEHNIPSAIFESIKSTLVYTGSKLTNVGLNLANYIRILLLQTPTMFVYTMITITATYMMANNLEKVNNFFEKQFPASWLATFGAIKKDVIGVTFSYIKSQLILIVLCFAELFIGFNIINLFLHPLNYVLLISVLIAIIDALPILGTGTVLIPWTVIAIIGGNYTLGAAILVLYVIVFVLRSVLEPRILSKNLSIDPLLSLVAMFVGFKLFGVIGFLVGPIMMTVITILFEEEINNGFFKTISGEE